MAYDQYNQEGQELLNQYGILGDRENTNYGRYRDTVSDYNTERNYLSGRYDSERNYDYGKYSDDRNFNYGKYSDDKSYAYNEHRNAIADEQWQKQFDAVYGKINGNTEGENPTGGYNPTGGSKPTGGSYNNGSLSASQIKELQKALGVTSDGMYGSASQNAAGGLSAEEAYKKYVNKTPEVRTNLMDFNRDDYSKNVEKNGGSFYGSALSDLKALKKAGKSNKEAQTYLAELVANSILTGTEYTRLYNMYRDNKL
jgi:hypothetical protein